MRKRRKPLADINVVPYIDVMLVLLVIFMITAPLLSQGVTVELPKAQAQTLSGKEKDPLIVSVDRHGNYFLNSLKRPDTPVSPHILLERITAELQQAKQQGQTRLVFVKGDKEVDYGRVVQAMVLLQKAGAEHVGLMTEQPSL